LQQRDIAGFAYAAAGKMRRQRAGSRWGSFVRSGKKLFRVGDRFERLDTGLQQFRHGLRSPESQQQTHFGVVEDG
jgi:hypothetical protein